MCPLKQNVPRLFLARVLLSTLDFWRIIATIILQNAFLKGRVHLKAEPHASAFRNLFVKPDVSLAFRMIFRMMKFCFPETVLAGLWVMGEG